MKVTIFGTESLGVRGLSCLVHTGRDRILIDPGVALGYVRHGLLPHPFQVAMGVKVRERIVSAIQKATRVVFSHFHGDHVPLAEANPFQLSLARVDTSLKPLEIYAPGTQGLSGTMLRRRMDLEHALGRSLGDCSGRWIDMMTFSTSVPHGVSEAGTGSVMMTRIKGSDTVFVHASDIQLLNREAVEIILDWRPDMVLASGPPLYLNRLGPELLEQAREHARMLARAVPVLILDHHLLRCHEGWRWLQSLKESGPNRVLCAAEFMNRPPCLLEARRDELYRDLPVPPGWHDAYAAGSAGTTGFRKWRNWDLDREG